MKSIHDICKEYDITNYTINDDGTIDVNGRVSFISSDITELPLRFNKVSGNFNCGNNRLTTLKGSPKWVGGYFGCNNNRLSSLEFSPEYVSDDFYCINNKLVDNYCDTEISGEFFTNSKQYGLVFNGNRVTNYNEWRKLYKRKKILNELYTRHM